MYTHTQYMYTVYTLGLMFQEKDLCHRETSRIFGQNVIIELSIGGKETKRTVYYRCAPILAASQVRGKINTKAQLLLDTLVKIQEIGYGSEAARSPRSVLQFHNLTRCHGILCRVTIGFTLNYDQEKIIWHLFS